MPPIVENPRYVTLFRMADHFLITIDPDLENIKINEINLMASVNEYYDNLQTWKDHFGCPDGIDHYKIAALTAHYLIKNPTFKLLDSDNRAAIYRCASLVFALEVTVSRLIEGKSGIVLGKRKRAEILRLFLTHQNNLQAASIAGPVVLHEIAHSFISALIIIVTTTEEQGFDIDTLPI